MKRENEFAVGIVVIAAFALIVGGVLIAVAAVMREAVQLADENAAFV